LGAFGLIFLARCAFAGLFWPLRCAARRPAAQGRMFGDYSLPQTSAPASQNRACRGPL